MKHYNEIAAWHIAILIVHAALPSYRYRAQRHTTHGALLDNFHPSRLLINYPCLLMVSLIKTILTLPPCRNNMYNETKTSIFITLKFGAGIPAAPRQQPMLNETRQANAPEVNGLTFTGSPQFYAPPTLRIINFHVPARNWRWVGHTTVSVKTAKHYTILGVAILHHANVRLF